MSKSFATEKNTKTSLDGGHSFAAVGLVIGLFAFFLSMSTPWVMAEFQPPPAVTEDAGFSFSTWFYHEMFGREDVAVDEVAAETVQEKPEVSREDHWTRYWSLLVMAVAMAGLINSTIGVLQRQNNFVCITGISLCIIAIVFQYFIIAVSILVILVILVFLLSAIGVDF